MLTQSLKRQRKKVTSLKNLIFNLKKNNLINNQKGMILENMSSINRLLLQRKVTKTGKYSPEIRKFAITLNFFPPKAYKYIS